MDFVPDDVRKDIMEAKYLIKRDGISALPMIDYGSEGCVYEAGSSAAVKLYHSATKPYLNVYTYFPIVDSEITLHERLIRRCKEGIKQEINFAPVIDMQELTINDERRLCIFMPWLRRDKLTKASAHFSFTSDLLKVGADGIAEMFRDNIKLNAIGIATGDKCVDNYIITDTHINRIDVTDRIDPMVMSDQNIEYENFAIAEMLATNIHDRDVLSVVIKAISKVEHNARAARFLRYYDFILQGREKE